MGIDLIVIHCSASPQGRGDNAETIHEWHKRRGWDGIGYHHVILENGAVEAGRPEYWTGAHAKGYNLNSIGICLIGEDTFTLDQMQSLSGLVKAKVKQYPGCKVVGHYQVQIAKQCPNFDVPMWLQAEGIAA